METAGLEAPLEIRRVGPGVGEGPAIKTEMGCKEAHPPGTKLTTARRLVSSCGGDADPARPLTGLPDQHQRR